MVQNPNLKILMKDNLLATNYNYLSCVVNAVLVS